MFKMVPQPNTCKLIIQCHALVQKQCPQVLKYLQQGMGEGTFWTSAGSSGFTVTWKHFYVSEFVVNFITILHKHRKV